MNRKQAERLSKRKTPSKSSKRTKKMASGKKRGEKGLVGLKKAPVASSNHTKNRHRLILKLKRRLLQVHVRGHHSKDSDLFRSPFQRSPGPPPTASIIPPPTFLKMVPYKLRPRTTRDKKHIDMIEDELMDDIDEEQ